MLSNQWFILTTNPQREDFVAEQLKGNDPYLPRFKNVKGHIRPLFPSYLFLPALANWGPICNTIGVRGLLMSGEHPACISGRVITSWRDKERGGLVQLPPPPRFRPGERLTITKGSLKYREVIHAGMVGRDREKVLISMLGQHVTIIVPTTDLASEFRAPPRNRLRRTREASIRQQGARAFAEPCRPN